MLENALFLAWKDDKEISLKLSYDLIKAQMANKSTEKILLKVALNVTDGSSLPDSVSFAFTTLEDRDAAINAIKKGMAAAQAAASAPAAPSTGNQGPVLSEQDIAARQRLLATHAEWRQLHRELVVVRKTLTEEEFWESRKSLLDQQQWVSNQKRGTSSSLLADIKPTDEDNSTGIKFTLNPDIIHSIFTQYPGVHAAYLDYVPDKLSEKDFWTKYFTSKYFHRNRGSQTKQSQEKDIFASYIDAMENDTNPHPANLVFDSQNKLLDLERT
ncbi:hypothetical protein HDU91_003549, partial [Kappamyces sp. JEL0680]